MDVGDDWSDAILQYFQLGYEYKDILLLLDKYHGKSMSLPQLKRFLKAEGLKRKGQYASDDVVRATIQEVLDDGQIYMGYRTLWQHLKRKYHVHCRRDTVMKILKELDPVGAYQRRSRRLERRIFRSVGPNFTWHVDGYDKLKPFGFAVHGCIDGFSRKLIWLHAASSNNNPSVIARYFLDSVKQAEGVPALLRCDRGTENGTIHAMQCFLRLDHDDGMAGEKSFISGSSLSNQRIESFWSLLRKTRLEKWISTFKDLVLWGVFNKANPLHSDILRFCCMDVLRGELEDVKAEWNNHRIRFSRMAECPPGIPSLLYALPEKYGGQDSLKPVTDHNIQDLEDECSSPTVTQNPDLFHFLNYVMNECDYEYPATLQGGIALFMKLVEVVID